MTPMTTLPLTTKLGERLAQQHRVHVPCGRLRIDEVRLGTGVDNRVRRRCEGQRRCDHDIPGADAQCQQPEMQCRRARAERNAVRDAHPFGKFMLERIDVRTERRDPPRAHGCDDRIFLELAHVGRRHVDALTHFEASTSSSTTRSTIAVSLLRGTACIRASHPPLSSRSGEIESARVCDTFGWNGRSRSSRLPTRTS